VAELKKYIFRQEKSDYGGIVDPAKNVFIGKEDGKEALGRSEAGQ